MRIALACPYAWDDPGGVQVHVRELAERLIGEGHQVVVLAPVRAYAPEPFVRPVGRPVDIPYNASNAPIDPRPWSRTAVRRILANFRPDVAHVHEPFTPSTSLWVTLASPAPVVATFHSGATRSRLYDAGAPLLRRVARRLSARIAVSEAAARTARSRIGGAFQIVPIGVDVRRFADAQGAELGPGTKLLFIGRLDQRKGFPTAVAAFAQLAADRPDVRLIVVGDGPDRGAIDRLSPDARSRVTMVGSLPNVDLPPYPAACDVLLAPSNGGESFGVILVEGMAAGLPVVASNIPGYDEVVSDGVEGLLVPPGDARSLATATARILDDRALRAKLAAGASARAARCDWPGVVARIQDIYARAVSQGPASVQ